MSGFPSRQMIPDRFSPSRVRFAAARPGPIRADPVRHAVYEGKGGLRFRATAVGGNGEAVLRAERELSAIPAA